VASRAPDGSRKRQQTVITSDDGWFWVCSLEGDRGGGPALRAAGGEGQGSGAQGL